MSFVFDVNDLDDSFLGSVIVKFDPFSRRKFIEIPLSYGGFSVKFDGTYQKWDVIGNNIPFCIIFPDKMDLALGWKIGDELIIEDILAHGVKRMNITKKV